MNAAVTAAARPPITPHQRSAVSMAYSPNLDRAGMKRRDDIVRQMADDLGVFAANTGSVSDADMELLGWTPAQLATHGRDASRRAYARAAERPSASARSRASETRDAEGPARQRNMAKR